MSRLDATGRLTAGHAPTKEQPLHTALYDTRRDTGAVVHLHSTHSVAVSMLPGIDPADAIPPMTAYYVMKLGRTALLPYHRPGDPAVVDAIRGLAGQYSSDYGSQFAVMVLTSIPAIIIYAIFNEQITKGVTAGAVKG